VKVDTPALRAMKAQAGIAACPSGTTGSSAVADGMPDVTLPCLGGGPEVDLAGLRGPLLVNFWAQTCGPCRTESPLLEQFARAAKGQVGVVGVDFYDPRPGMAIEFAKARGVTYPQLADPDGVSKGPLRIAALPYTFFVAPSGRIAYTQVGPISSPAQLATLVEQHLGVTLATGAGR
jgi:thiol-disulfide isomerase/thioredoxin